MNTQELEDFWHPKSLMTFRSWLYRLRRDRDRASSKLMEIVTVPQGDSETVCVVQLGAAEVRFSACPEPDYIAALLESIRRVGRLVKAAGGDVYSGHLLMFLSRRRDCGRF